MKINFLVADEIRPEANSKQTVLGLFADNVIVLEPSPELPASSSEMPEGIERLALLINVSEIEGMHSYKGQIFDPTGKPHGPELSFGESQLVGNTSRTIIVESKPFLFKEKGRYNFVLTIDEEKHFLPFTIIDRKVSSTAE